MFKKFWHEGWCVRKKFGGGRRGALWWCRGLGVQLEFLTLASSLLLILAWAVIWANGHINRSMNMSGFSAFKKSLGYFVFTLKSCVCFSTL
jgi:hypothetical protein